MRDENSGGNDLLAAREILRVYHVVPTRVLDLEFLERRRSPNERAVARRRTLAGFLLSGATLLVSLRRSVRILRTHCYNRYHSFLVGLQNCHCIIHELYTISNSFTIR